MELGPAHMSAGTVSVGMGEGKKENLQALRESPSTAAAASLSIDIHWRPGRRPCASPWRSAPPGGRSHLLHQESSIATKWACERTSRLLLSKLAHEDETISISASKADHLIELLWLASHQRRLWRSCGGTTIVGLDDLCAPVPS